MPHRWFRCPDESFEGRDEYGRVDIQACLGHSTQATDRGCDWTFPVLNYFVQVERDYLSPTTLQRCPREVFLRHASDYAVDPAKAWARTRGTLQHAALEKYAEGITEVKLQRSIEIDGVTYVLQGQADNIIPEQGLVRDWKTTGSISRLLKFGELPKADHIEQLSLYGWLAAGDNHIYDELNTTNLQLTYGEVVYIDPYGMKRYTFPLWDHDTVEQVIRARLPRVAKQMTQGLAVSAWRAEGKNGEPPVVEQLPDVLPAEDQWRCDWCDVRDQCTILALREGQEPPRSSRPRKDKVVKASAAA